MVSNTHTHPHTCRDGTHESRSFPVASGLVCWPHTLEGVWELAGGQEGMPVYDPSGGQVARRETEKFRGCPGRRGGWPGPRLWAPGTESNGQMEERQAPTAECTCHDLNSLVSFTRCKAQGVRAAGFSGWVHLVLYRVRIDFSDNGK